MSIKKLFDPSNQTRNYLTDTTSKDAFLPVESEKNLKSLSEKQNEFIPQVDYSKPERFARYGSAYLYYKGAIEHIYDYYPYDGSDFEINEFNNKLLGVEKYIFDNRYPRTNGHAKLSADGWGSLDGSLVGGYGTPSSLEFITFYGGPHTSSYTNLADAFPSELNSKRDQSNVYDTSIYTTDGLPSNYGSGTRQSNLKSNFDTGVTIEFWLQKDGFNNSLTEKEVVFDMWNSASAGTDTYGRMRIELTGAATGSPFLITAKSSSSGIFQQSIGQNLTTASLQDFSHYAFVFYNSGPQFITELYVNGTLNDTNTSVGAVSELNSKNMIGRIGALLTSSVGPGSALSGSTGGGKLSGSIDEFRFWKARRNGEDIGLNWKSQVRGGTNTDISNTTLGVYYKFNEGITSNSSLDSTVLDYSGRISNGAWTGYDSYSRSTASAFVEAGVRTSEYLDPIIYSTHPDVVSLESELLTRGTNYDLQNNSSFVNTLPAWIIEAQDNKDSDLKIVSHIVGTYLDKLYLQIESLPRLKTQTYTSASVKPVPFAVHMPQSLGLYTPDLFIDSSVLEKFKNRTEDTFLESDLNETKNLIYLNLYNSLTGIFKAKGTEKAIRNVLRCFNLDDRVIKLKTYSNKNIFTLKNNLKESIVPNTSVNFDNISNVAGVVYQASDPSNPDSFAFISGSYTSDREARYGFSYETNVTFPRFNTNYSKIDRSFEQISLFGLALANTSSASDTTQAVSDPVNLQVYAVRPEKFSKNVYFKLTSSVDPSPFPELTSSLFFDVYEDTQWNFSIRLKPSNYPLTDVLTGSDDYTYDLEFRGINAVGQNIINSFLLTSSISKAVGSEFLKSAKRIYAGAKRVNITGALEHKSDVCLNNVKYWTKYIDASDIEQHLYDINNSGISGSYENFSPVDSNLTITDVKNANSLALHWTFDNITGSDSSGNFFYVTDMSSGSAQTRNNYGWVGAIGGYQHNGYGFGFAQSSTNVVKNEKTSMLKFVDPEMPVSSDMIQVYDRNQKFFFDREVKPDFFFNIEKSMYEAISEEMLTFFAGVVDFNNVIGEPVNRYRERYKSMEKLRETFFKRVTKTSNVEKFINYYKWLDDSIAIVIDQLLPAGGALKADTYNIIESHVLERNKYQTRFPMLTEVESTEGTVKAINELTYNWKFGHAPTNASQSDNELWWSERAIRSGVNVTSNNTTVDTQREKVRQVIGKNNNQLGTVLNTIDGTAYSSSVDIITKRTLPYKIEIKRLNTIKGGVNFNDSKDLGLAYNAVYPAGPVNTSGTIFVPENVLLAFTHEMSDIAPITNDVLEPNAKTKRHFKVLFGRVYEGGLGYYNMKSSRAFPFNLFSSSLTTGYNSLVVEGLSASVELTNLHNDVYGSDMEKPMQGPFTEYAVGGHQSRHIAINKGSDNHLNRAEAWKIVLGFSNSAGVDGAIGLVGPDYPVEDNNYAGYTASYPVPTSEKAVYYRDFTAKRPVNIKNILMKTGSTILGNYVKNYELVSTVGGFSNPRAFIKNPPALPLQITQTPSASQGRSILDTRRTDDNHFEFIPDYQVSYLHGNTNNKSVIRSRFSAPGSVEVLGQGYGDIRSNDFSVYNSINYRNLSVRKPFQSMGSTSEATGSGTTGIRASDQNKRDHGLVRNLQSHAGRFGRDELVTDPGSSLNQNASLHKVNRNRLAIPIEDADGNLLDGSSFDNFFVQHQIPRSDRQYAWFTGSLAHEALQDYNRYGGFAPVNGVQAGLFGSGVGNNRTYVSFFDFVTASSVGSYGVLVPAQPSSELNIQIVDPVDALNDNNLGLSLSTDPTNYYNMDLLPAGHGFVQTRNADFFNMLMTKRKNTFGYRGVPFTGPTKPAVIRRQMSRNEFSYVSSPLQRTTFKPVSYKNRNIEFNLSSSMGDVSIKMDYEENNTYFGNSTLDDKFISSDVKDYETVFEQLNRANFDQNESIAYNWGLYSELLYPSDRNEFNSQSATRVGYDNLYWRDDQQSRYNLHRDKIFFNSFDIRVSQSSWPLDAPTDFLTRTSADIPFIGSGLTFLLANSNSAGELQNEYLHVHPAAPAINQSFKNRNTKLASLYARKSLLENPRSVVTPAGMDVPETGSGFTALPTVDDISASFSSLIQPYGGIASWEAASQAGVVGLSSSTTIFTSASSNPWYSTVEDFNSDLKLISRGYSVVPEFRISEHIKDYLKFGILSENKFNTFEIVGTEKDSSDSNFYVDYSNSDFFKEFANIKDSTGMMPDEFMLICSASIKFNPYKGFYPAQRTVDLVEQFKDSYGNAIQAESDGISAPGVAGAARPLAQAMFAPGILFNTIKSGLAVDYPIVLDSSKINKEHFGNSSDTAPGIAWMATTDSGSYTGGQYWDKRIPFEAIIDPAELAGVDFYDMEAHPSASTNTTASFIQVNTDNIYKKMASNFFGAVPNFFLKDSSYTTLRSETVSNDLKFKDGEVYGARVKVYRSMSGSRTYELESGSSGNNIAFSTNGAKFLDTNASPPQFNAGTSYPLPQDPRRKLKEDLQETFTLYSRPLAFGPEVSGRPTGSNAAISDVLLTNPVGPVNGENPSFTPPYYNGECWLDILFTPRSNTTYDLKKILAEVDVVSWRFDPGPSASAAPVGSTTSYTDTQFIPSYGTNISDVSSLIYDGNNINTNCMQLTASFNVFGIEEQFETTTDNFNNPYAISNTSNGARWVLSPKFETPHLNFNNQGIHPITNADGNLTLPQYSSGSVPRGIWHQFGVIPPEEEVGIFFEISEIDKSWLKYHYDVRNNNSVYNNFNAAVSGALASRKIKPLTNIIPFKEEQKSRKLGQIADSQSIYEAVVVVPYQHDVSKTVNSELSFEKKRFFNIDREKIDSCLDSTINSAEGDSLDAAGISIRNLVRLMEKYVLPPQFDFINNTDIDPIAMYIFEFEYKLDRDDLSYIWQNIAPRNYKKTTIESVSTAHKVGENELLTSDDLSDPNTRFMVFKAKFRGMDEYDDTLVGAKQKDSSGYELSFNWPYDYVSIVELAKIEAKALFKPEEKQTKDVASSPSESGASSRQSPRSTSSNISLEENVAASNRY